MWNVADYAGLLFLGFGLIDGYRKGLVKKGTSLMLTLVTLFVVYLAAPYVETFLAGILPDALNLERITGTDSELYRILVMSGLGDKAESGVRTLAARVLSWVVTYLVVKILLRTLALSLELLVKVPGLSFLNRILGAGLGLILQIVLIWLLFLVILVFSSTGWGSAARDVIAGSAWIYYLYDHNMLLLLLIMLLIVV